MRRYLIAFGIVACTLPIHVSRATDYDLTKDRILEVVGTAHLDTQWRWTIQQTINEYIPNTLRQNFQLFESYPNYTFSFEGAFRYMLAKEYYPRDYARLADYIKRGRWAVCGSSLDAGDVNIPSPEALIRNILYGQEFYKREFGVSSRDIFLPDCFGFGYVLPTVEVHCGLKGFSSQKLTWGSAIGIPFDVGVWEGVDGSQVIAALNPNPYVSRIRSDLSKDKRWIDTVEKQGKLSGLYVGYKYFGTGDVGGAPDPESVSMLEESMKGDGPLTVVSVPADKLFREITPEQMKQLPHYKGELLMTTHGAGCYTSQAALKRWNRMNEQLADAAERSSVAASWLGGATYPQKKLNDAWKSVIWHQFHDDLTGTSIPEAYTFTWNDYVVAMNQFSAIVENGTGAVARMLDTAVDGQPVVVYNPLARMREDVVEAEIIFPDAAPATVRVFDSEGTEVPSQVLSIKGSTVKVAFLASVCPVGFRVFDLRPANSPCNMPTGLSASRSSLENERYRVTVDSNGDVSGIYDKAAGRELLAEPIRLELLNNESPVWPAWEITYESVSTAPKGYVGGPATITVLENGPARVSLEIVRKSGDSTFTQILSLASGAAGDALVFSNDVDWRSKGTLLKVSVPMTVSNPKATYDLGIGVIERGNNTEKMYEVPAQQWADITDTGGSYGISIFNDSKYGWDKPSDNVLRLSLIHTPEPRSYSDQAMQDIGVHTFAFAVTGHTGDWRDGDSAFAAARFNQKLKAFQPSKHPGERGRRFAFLNSSSPQLAVTALKKAENSDEIVVRVVEKAGRQLDGALLSFPAAVISAREVNGAEEPVGDAKVVDGQLSVDLKPFQPRAYAVRIAYPDGAELSKPLSVPVKLPYDTDVMSLDGGYEDGAIDDAGRTIAGELVPETLESEDILFTLGPPNPGAMNAVSCHGQQIELPAGPSSNGFNRLYILAAAVGGDTSGTFTLGRETHTVKIQDYTEFVGQWDNRLINGRPTSTVFQVQPAYIKRHPIAWVGTHRHDPTGVNEAYIFTYMYRYSLDIPSRTRTITLPDNDNIKIFAISAGLNFNDDTRPALDMYDRAMSTSVKITSDTLDMFVGTTSIALIPFPEGAEIRYTLDDSAPSERSQMYRGPITLNDSATLKAIAISPDIEDRHMLMMDFTKTTPVAAVDPGRVKQGISCKLYNGSFDALPNFAKIPTASTVSTESFSIPDGVPEDAFALQFSGYINIPSDGVYWFATRSDDGSRLFLGETLLVDNDGLHGVQEESATIALNAGYHKITVDFFEKGGGQELTVLMSGPGIQRGNIAPSLLWSK